MINAVDGTSRSGLHPTIWHCSVRSVMTHNMRTVLWRLHFERHKARVAWDESEME